jgi:hypothetical protein
MKQNIKKLLSRIAALLSRFLQWMYAWAEKLDGKLIAWMERHPKISAWLPVSTMQVTQKSRILVCVLLGLILCFPVRTELPDGGSVEYRSLTYSLVRWEFFTEEIPDPRDADKVTVVRFYDPLTCRVRSIWERQSDQAALLGCNAYHVTQSKSQNRIDKYGQTVYNVTTIYNVRINGYATSDQSRFVYDESGWDKDHTYGGVSVTWWETQITRLLMDLRIIRMNRATPPLKTLITEEEEKNLTGETEEVVKFWRMYDPEHRLHGKLIPIKEIRYYTTGENHVHMNSITINLLDNRILSCSTCR